MLNNLIQINIRFNSVKRVKVCRESPAAVVTISTAVSSSSTVVVLLCITRLRITITLSITRIPVYQYTGILKYFLRSNWTGV